MSSGRQGGGGGAIPKADRRPWSLRQAKINYDYEGAHRNLFSEECDGRLLWFRDIHEAFVLIPEPKSYVDLILSPLGLNSRLLG